MTDEECSVIFDELLGLLRARRDADRPIERDDYVLAIETEVALGKPVTVNINVADDRKTVDPVAGVRTSGQSSKAEFVAYQEYTGREKLVILLDLFALATLAPPKMAREMINGLGTLAELEKVEAFNFGNDVTSSPARSLTVSSLLDAVGAINDLESLISELRTELAKTEA